MEGPRACRPDELPSLRQLVDRVFRPGTDPLCPKFPTLFDPSNLDHLRVMIDDGRAVSSINYTVRTVDISGNVLTVGSIGAVSTYEDYRGRGLATTLLEDTFTHMREEGVDVALISGTRGLYQRAGCALGGHEARCALDSEALSRVPGDGISVAEATDRDIPTLIAIHRTEPARYIRSAFDWAGYLSVCRLSETGVEPPWGARRCWIVKHGDTPLAFVVVSFNREREQAAGDLVEFGGARSAAFAGLRRVAEQFSLARVGVRVRLEDIESLAILRSVGAEPEPRALGGHRFGIMTNDIFDRFRPWLVERVGDILASTFRIVSGSGAWRIAAGNGKVEVGDFEALNGLLFGDGAAQLAEDGEAAELVRRALPFPWLLPGLNYI